MAGRRQFLQGGAAAGLLVATGAGLTACRDLAPVSFATGGDGDLVVGPGGWCWFQAPRATFNRGRLYLGTSVSSTGTKRDGDLEVTEVDVTTRGTVRHTVGHTRPDDHAAPSVLAVDGEIQVTWSTHNRNSWIEVGRLGTRLHRIGRPDSLVAPGRGVSYASAHVVAGRRWLLYRGEQFSWNLLVSADGGRTWTPRGLVVAPADGQRPYLQAASDGRRLHITISDGNPSEFRGTNIWYATVDADPELTIRTSTSPALGRVGSEPVQPQAMTRLVAGRSAYTEAADTDAWLCDLQVVDGRPTAILSVRDPWPFESSAIGGWRHAYRWARQTRGGGWTVEHLAWAGSELYWGQPDYCGLASVDPTNPNRVVVSTNVHPATGEPLVSSGDGLAHWELWEGVRSGTASWSWTAVTADSTVDNIRPVIAVDFTNKALAWMRGTYRDWTHFATDIVVRPV